MIDDETSFTRLLKLNLEATGKYSVEVENDPQQAVSVALQFRPDVILLDVMMPEKGGLSTLVALRKDDRTKAIPVVLVTGIQETLTADFEAFLNRFKAYNPNGYMEKPIDPEKLVSTLDELTGTAS